MDLYIEPARPEDKNTVVTLLKQEHLVTDDLPDNLSDFVIAREDNILIGVAGLEQFEDVGLLRSVAVDQAFQGKRIGSQLTEHVLKTAQAARIREVYLITTTANHYFERHGFQAVNRQEVPASIQQTRQFSDLCPSTAVVMKRVLTQHQE